MLNEIIKISQKYVGKIPAEMDCELWTELRKKLATEIRDVVKKYADFQIPSNKTFEGIDERKVKCCDKDEHTIQSGISLCEDEGTKMLRFHFLECHYKKVDLLSSVSQTTKTMHLDEQNTNKLIAMLLELNS